MSKQQTAVEWLIMQLPVKIRVQLYEQNIHEQAKQIEKKRHDKWNEFLNAEKTLGVSDVKTIERIQWYYNQYYNETYK